jgi:DNA-binding GntR family transcriptional regulator
LRELEALERKMDDLYSRLGRGKGLSAADKFSALFGTFSELHELVLNVRRNLRFLDIIRNLSGPWSLARRKLLSGLGEEALVQGYKEHKEIIQALKKQNPVAAERAMRMHLRHSRRRYVLAHER